jgi:hypothetical protein
MLSFVYGHDEEIAKFVATFGPTGSDFGRCKTIGVINDEGNLIAGLVYFNYSPDAATLEFGAAAIDRRWFSRDTYRRMFAYPFVICGCQMLRGWVRADNEHLLSQLARINFNLTLVPRHYGRSEDGVLCTLTDDQWLDCKLSRRVYRDIDKMEAA